MCIRIVVKQIVYDGIGYLRGHLCPSRAIEIGYPIAIMLALKCGKGSANRLRCNRSLMHDWPLNGVKHKLFPDCIQCDEYEPLVPKSQVYVQFAAGRSPDNEGIR